MAACLLHFLPSLSPYTLSPYLSCGWAGEYIHYSKNQYTSYRSNLLEHGHFIPVGRVESSRVLFDEQFQFSLNSCLLMRTGKLEDGSHISFKRIWPSSGCGCGCGGWFRNINSNSRSCWRFWLNFDVLRLLLMSVMLLLLNHWIISSTGIGTWCRRCLTGVGMGCLMGRGWIVAHAPVVRKILRIQWGVYRGWLRGRRSRAGLLHQDYSDKWGFFFFAASDAWWSRLSSWLEEDNG